MLYLQYMVRLSASVRLNSSLQKIFHFDGNNISSTVAAFHKCGKSLISMSRYRNEYINNNCSINDFLTVFWKTVENGMDPPLSMTYMYHWMAEHYQPCALHVLGNEWVYGYYIILSCLAM